MRTVYHLWIGCHIQNHQVWIGTFFVAVKINVGYTAVADFVLQSENAELIAEALKILSSWNPKWQPPYFTTDYSEAEIEAIQGTFPACKVYLCDFQREQAWERWVKDKKHGLSLALLCLLWDVAQSPSSVDDDKPLNHHYHQNVNNWKVQFGRIIPREWLQGKWLCSPQVNLCRIRCISGKRCRRKGRGGAGIPLPEESS